jgi:hypothetical protein
MARPIVSLLRRPLAHPPRPQRHAEEVTGIARAAEVYVCLGSPERCVSSQRQGCKLNEVLTVVEKIRVFQSWIVDSEGTAEIPL